jgi:hypothetical protein
MTATAEDPTITNPPPLPADVESCTRRIINATEYYRPCDMLSREFNVSTGLFAMQQMTDGASSSPVSVFRRLALWKRYIDRNGKLAA